MKHEMHISINYVHAIPLSKLAGEKKEGKHLITWEADGTCSCGFTWSEMPDYIDRRDYYSKELLKVFRQRIIARFRYRHKKLTGEKWDKLVVHEDESLLRKGDPE